MQHISVIVLNKYVLHIYIRNNNILRYFYIICHFIIVFNLKQQQQKKLYRNVNYGKITVDTYILINFRFIY